MVPDSEIIFNISGSALSVLYYECEKSEGDQVGFLLGERHSFVKKTISDFQMNGEKNEIIINIVAVLPIGSPFLFCNNSGRIDRTKLKELFGSLYKDICGWYVFRRNFGLCPLLRETILHKELLDALPQAMPQSFVLCCISSDISQSRSTHRVRHVFLLHKNRIFEPISVPVINLGQPEDKCYRTVAVTTSSNKSFNDIVSSIRMDNNLGGGLTALKALQKPLQEKIMEIAAEVQRFDKKTQQLRNELQELKEKESKPNNVLIESKNQNDIGKNIHPGDHGDTKLMKKYDYNDEDEDELLKDDEEKNEKAADEKGDKYINDDSSNELVGSSQMTTESFQSGMKERNFSSPIASPAQSHGGDKIIIEESNLPSNSGQFSPSQEY